MNNEKIIKKNKISLLFCNNQMVNFYKFYKWKLLPKKNYITDMDEKLNCMIYNDQYNIVNFKKDFLKIKLKNNDQNK